MNVLMVDVGGSNVKIMNSRGGEMRKFPSGRELTGPEMVTGVKDLASGWNYDCVSIGFPGLLRNGRPARDPLNLGGGWMDLDYEAAFDGRPVRMINDAALQALGNYDQGRLLFMGFGTSIGTCVIVDDLVVPIEIGLIKFSKKKRFVDRLSKVALKTDGLEKWTEAVLEAVVLLQDVFHPDETVLGGGNAKKLISLPALCRMVGNTSAYRGAERLWEDADMFATPLSTSWQIRRNESGGQGGIR
jgi:polyphosphate glucokinase